MAVFENHVNVTLGELERNLTGFKIEDYILSCEERFDNDALKIAEDAVSNEKIRAIFISGPTASGKTIFTGKLAGYLHDAGKPTVTLSLDDYYYFTEYATDNYGRPDFESLEILDTKLMLEQIEALIEGKEVLVPKFDFIVKERDPNKFRKVAFPENGVLLVEGLHGLSKYVSGMLPKFEWLGVFIMPYATLMDDIRLLDSRDIRILRRSARDVLHRGASALSTIDYWPMLDVAEDLHFPEYLKNADYYINSIIPYEFYCVAPLAHDLILKSLDDFKRGKPVDSNLTQHKGLAQPDLALQEAERLISATGKIPRISLSLVPKTSILNEFIR